MDSHRTGVVGSQGREHARNAAGESNWMLEAQRAMGAGAAPALGVRRPPGQALGSVAGWRWLGLSLRLFSASDHVFRAAARRPAQRGGSQMFCITRCGGGGDCSSLPRCILGPSTHFLRLLLLPSNHRCFPIASLGRWRWCCPTARGVTTSHTRHHLNKPGCRTPRHRAPGGAPATPHHCRCLCGHAAHSAAPGNAQGYAHQLRLADRPAEAAGHRRCGAAACRRQPHGSAHV